MLPDKVDCHSERGDTEVFNAVGTLDVLVASGAEVSEALEANPLVDYGGRHVRALLGLLTRHNTPSLLVKNDGKFIVSREGIEPPPTRYKLAVLPLDQQLLLSTLLF